MKLYRILLMCTLLASSTVQSVVAASEMGVLGTCWSYITKIPLAPGNMVARITSDFQVGGYPVGQKFQGWMPKFIISFVTYYFIIELIGSIRAKYRKITRERPKQQMIQMAVDQLVFLKNAQQKLSAAKQNEKKRQEVVKEKSVAPDSSSDAALEEEQEDKGEE